MAQQLEHQQSNNENRLPTEHAYDIDMSRPPPSTGSIELLPSREPSPPPSDSTEGQEQTPLDAVRAVKIEYHRKLTWWDVAALIINKMIGIGIFSGPPTVLLYTGKKSTALWLWAAGFVYTLIRYAIVSDYLLE
jgi:Amino acid permease